MGGTLGLVGGAGGSVTAARAVTTPPTEESVRRTCAPFALVTRIRARALLAPVRYPFENDFKAKWNSL